ncbi:MAG: hydrolase, partial [Cellulophaga baltica]
FNFSVDTNYTYLVNEFDPSRTADAIALPANSEYTYSTAAMNFSSDSRKAFSYSLEQSYGAFFNGTRASSAAEMTLRLQPKAAISLLVSYDKITLPAPYSSADFWLVSPSFEFTFSKSIFWSTLVQYSNQRNNLGFNSRLQWRFAPLSDLFIVYNDNYIVNDFEPRNRSINLKFTYWLNI